MYSALIALYFILKENSIYLKALYRLGSLLFYILLVKRVNYYRLALGCL